MRLIAILFVLLWAAPAVADDTIRRGPSAGWVKPPAVASAASDPAPGAPVRVLLLDQQVRLDEAGQHTFFHYRMQVLSPVGLQVAGNVGIAWSPSVQTLTVHGVTVERNGGVVDVLASQDFAVLRRESGLESAMLDGVLTASLQPADLRVGDVLDVSYSISGKDPVLGDHVEALGAAQAQLPVDTLRVVASWPTDRRVQVRATDGWTMGPVRREGGFNWAVIEMGDAQPLEIPDDAPGRFRLWRQLELTDYREWGELAAVMTPLYVEASRLEENSPLAAEVERIRGLSNDPRVQAAAALRLVQDDVRYLALMMGAGGLKPASADEAWRSRYGDCKAKTALLLALLHGLDITAVPALVSVAAGDGLDARLPMAGLFDHVLVKVEIQGQTYWLDGARIGDRDLADIDPPPYSWALPLTGSSSKLEAIARRPLTEPLIDVVARIDATAGLFAPAVVTGEMVFRGDLASVMNVQAGAAPPAQRDQVLNMLWQGHMPTFKPGTVETRYDADLNEFRVLVAGTAVLSRDADNNFYAAGTFLGVSVAAPREPGPYKDLPHLVAPGFNRKITTLRLPLDGEGVTLTAADVARDFMGYRYERRARLADGVITIEQSGRSLAVEISETEVVAGQDETLPWAVNAVPFAWPGYVPTAGDRAALEADAPTTSEEFARRGDLLFRSRDFPGAMAAYERAISLDPTNANAVANRGIVRYWTGDRAGAAVDFDSASDIDPSERIAMNGHALVALDEGRYQDAVVELSRALRQAPGDDFALTTRARAYDALRQHDKALADMDAAIGDQPPSVEYGLRRASILRAADRNDEALATIESLRAAWPEDPRPKLSQAELKLALHDIAGARAILDKTLASDPANIQVLFLRLDALLRQGELEAASADAAAIRAAADGQAVIFNNLCWAMATRRALLDAALRDCDAALALAPEVAGFLDSRAMVLLQMGDFEGALSTYDRALSKAPDMAGSLYGRGLAKDALGRTEEGAVDKAAALARDADAADSFETYLAEALGAAATSGP